jgi:hypothetical protein
MPRKTVRIPLSSVPPYEAAAEFFSYIAFSDPSEEIQRYEYCIALSRRALTVRATLDRHWGESIQPIRPLIFSRPDEIFCSILGEGEDRLSKRMICATAFVISRLGRSNKERIDGYAPNIHNIARTFIAKQFGYAQGSRTTILNRFWSPTKPVAHAAAAFIWTGVMDKPKSWHDEHPLMAKDAFLGTLFYPDVLKSIVRVSEGLRRMLPDLKLRIRDEDTIRFVTR